MIVGLLIFIQRTVKQHSFANTVRPDEIQHRDPY